MHCPYDADDDGDDDDGDDDDDDDGDDDDGDYHLVSQRATCCFAESGSAFVNWELKVPEKTHRNHLFILRLGGEKMQ